ncbi:MAG: YibE/F family protein [Spirochaetes bacterium]|nr:YibE/F family protein [Spirochaetota bacterium]
MKLKLGKEFLFFSAATAVMAAMVWFGANTNLDFGINLTRDGSYPRARVLEVIHNQTTVDANGLRRGRQEVLAEITSGEHRGRVVRAVNILFIDAAVYAQGGTRIVLFFDPQADGSYFARVHSYERATAIYAVVALFFLLLAVTGGKAGLRSVFGLVFTFVTLLFLLIPAIVRGAPPALLTVALSLLIMSVSLIAIMGFAKKTYVAIAGSSIGIFFYCIFYLAVSAALRITGFNIPEMTMLATVGFLANARIAELLFCGILIASLGAVTDTTVSVASTTAELSAAASGAGFNALFRSSMRMARDCVGSSANTLILAFTGAFFISLIVFRLNNFEYHMLIHRPDIAIEVLRIVAASSAMVLCAPATALIGSFAHAAKESAAAKRENAHSFAERGEPAVKPG